MRHRIRCLLKTLRPSPIRVLRRKELLKSVRNRLAQLLILERERLVQANQKEQCRLRLIIIEGRVILLLRIANPPPVTYPSMLVPEFKARIPSPR